MILNVGFGSMDAYLKSRFTAETQRALRGNGISGESVRGRFSRSSMPAAIDMPEKLRTFDLAASHHQIKNNLLFPILAALR
jgi:hypothetical protein